MVDFLDDRPGRWDTGKTVTDTSVGHYGDHDFYDSWDRYSPQTCSYRDAKRNGDHVHSTDYHRYSAKVMSETPIREFLVGGDWNGPYHDLRSTYISQFIERTVLNDPIVLTPLREEATRRCITDARNKFHNLKVEYGASIGETTKAVNMIAAPFSLLLQAYTAAKQGNWPKVTSLLGSPRKWYNGRYIADLWLQYQYGWKPLMADVHNGVNILIDALGSDQNTLKVVRNVSDSDTWEPDSGGGIFSDKWKIKVKVQVGLTADITSAALSTLDALGVLNPLAIAWELTPFSFVVDWFIPVGNVLESLSATAGLAFRDGYISYVTECHCVTKRNDNGIPSGWSIVDHGELIRENKQFDRVALTSFPLPALHMAQNPFSTPQAINALALLRQLM